MMKACGCKLNKKKECPGCLEQLRETSRLFEIALVEFVAKAHWIGKSRKPDCHACILKHADELGAFLMDDLAGIDPIHYGELHTLLVAFLVRQGITSIPKTMAAYEKGRFKGKRGVVRTLDEVLKVLYGRG